MSDQELFGVRIGSGWVLAAYPRWPCAAAHKYKIGGNYRQKSAERKEIAAGGLRLADAAG
jgi:hypothetical protein